MKVGARADKIYALSRDKRKVMYEKYHERKSRVSVVKFRILGMGKDVEEAPNYDGPVGGAAKNRDSVLRPTALT